MATTLSHSAVCLHFAYNAFLKRKNCCYCVCQNLSSLSAMAVGLGVLLRKTSPTQNMTKTSSCHPISIFPFSKTKLKLLLELQDIKLKRLNFPTFLLDKYGHVTKF